MTLHFDKTLKQLAALAYTRGIHYDLDHMQQALALLDYPEKKCPPIFHLAGSNGKGSTASFLKHALIHQGFRVGLYTSPHLHCYTERFQINFHAISPEDFVKSYHRVDQALPSHLGLCEFEYLSCMAFVYFSSQNCDYLILETGLGGRLDATNVCDPLASIITSISYDHQDILGHSLTEIANEKAGIIKKKRPVFTIASQEKIVLDVLRNIAKKKHCPLFLSHPLLSQELPPYQLQNAGLAKSVLYHFFPQYDETKNLTQLFESHTIPGRFEKFQITPHQKYIFDVAHNEAGIKALVDAIKHHRINLKETLLILSIQKRKDAKSMIDYLLKENLKIYYYQEANESYWSLKELQSIFSKELISSFIFENLPPAKNLVFTGSFYWIDDVKKKLKINKT